MSEVDPDAQKDIATPGVLDTPDVLLEDLLRPPGDPAQLESALGYSFRNKEYLTNALIHKSYLHEIPDYYLGSNERLEFLGDSVLGLIVSSDLYTSRPGVSEGHLTALRGA